MRQVIVQQDPNGYPIGNGEREIIVLFQIYNKKIYGF